MMVSGVFELAVIRMSRYYDVSQKAVLFLDCMLPMEAFMTTRDTAEMRLVSLIFDFARELAEMQLSETALALYSAYVLLQDGENAFKASAVFGDQLIFDVFTDRPDLQKRDDIKRLNQAVLDTLQRELTQRPPMVAVKGDVSVLSKLLNKRHTLRLVLQWGGCNNFFQSPISDHDVHREISFLHLEALNKFRTNTAGLVTFPALHRELFPTEA